MGQRNGDEYRVTTEELEAFHRDGYVHLEGVLDESELIDIEIDYERLISGDIPIEGRDFCDMSGDYGRRVEEFSIINVMLPRRYFPAWRDNIYEKRAASIARQLQGRGMALDYDQLLAKPPGKADAVFAWHQDLAYWPTDTPDTRTATSWLALDDSRIENGCMRFVPGSHNEPELRPHQPMMGDREDSHTLVAEVDQTLDIVRAAEISRGDVTVHHERVLHGSGGNRSDRWRRAYVVAFRSEETVAAERARGFTHSHNDDPDVLRRVGE